MDRPEAKLASGTISVCGAEVSQKTLQEIAAEEDQQQAGAQAQVGHADPRRDLPEPGGVQRFAEVVVEREHHRVGRPEHRQQAQAQPGRVGTAQRAGDRAERAADQRDGDLLVGKILAAVGGVEQDLCVVDEAAGRAFEHEKAVAHQADENDDGQYRADWLEHHCREAGEQGEAYADEQRLDREGVEQEGRKPGPVGGDSGCGTRGGHGGPQYKEKAT